MAEGQTQDIASLLADSCGRCGRANCDATCVECKIPYHKACVQSVSVWNSEAIICDECAAGGHEGRQDSLNKTIHKNVGAIRKSSFRPGQFQGNSTTATAEDYVEMKRKLKEMEQ